MVCIFCLKETKENVSFYGASELAKHARNVVTKHFWFDVSRCHRLDGKFDSFVYLFVLVYNSHISKSHCRPKKSTRSENMRVRIAGQKWNHFMIFMAWSSQITLISQALSMRRKI